jgi:hypothetical protein
MTPPSLIAAVSLLFFLCLALGCNKGEEAPGPKSSNDPAKSFKQEKIAEHQRPEAQMREALRHAAERELERKKNAELFYSNKFEILSEIKAAMSKKEHQKAFSLASKYSSSADKELEEVFTAATKQMVAETQRLEMEVNSLCPGQYKQKLEIYRMLAELRPDVPFYSNQVAEYTRRVEERERERKKEFTESVHQFEALSKDIQEFNRQFSSRQGGRQSVPPSVWTDDPDHPVNQRTRALAFIKKTKNPKDLIKGFALEEGAYAIYIVDELVEYGKDALPHLIKALKDRDYFVKCFAAETLLMLQDPSGSDALRALLEREDDGDLRNYAFSALVETNGATFDDLVNALQDTDLRNRILAASTLGKIGGPDAEEPLRQALQDERVEVRKEAIEALKKISGPDCLGGPSGQAAYIRVPGGVDPPQRQIAETEQELEYIILKREVGDTPFKTQVESHLLLRRRPSEDGLRQFLNRLYRHEITNGNYRHHPSPTHVGIYAYTSKKHFESGMAQWAGMLLKLPIDSQPKISINPAMLEYTVTDKEVRFGLPTEDRIEVFQGVILAERNAERRAKNSEEAKKIELANQKKLAKKYNLTLYQLDQVFLEGLRKNWPYPASD